MLIHPAETNGREAEIAALLTTSAPAILPKTVRHLVELCAKPAAGVLEIARVIKRDTSLASSMIRQANAVRRGGGIAVTNVEAAVLRMGGDRAKTAALACGIGETLAAAGSPGFRFGTYWRDCLARGCFATAIARGCHHGAAGEAFLVGVLQDLAIPIMAKRCGPNYTALLSRSHASGSRLAVLESQSMRFNHIHVGVLLLERWGLPPLVTDAIGRHHTRSPLLSTADPALKLWQIGYFVGALPIGQVEAARPCDPALGEMLLSTFELSGGAALCRQAEREFEDILELFQQQLTGETEVSSLFATTAAALDDCLSESHSAHRGPERSVPRDVPPRDLSLDRSAVPAIGVSSSD